MIEVLVIAFGLIALAFILPVLATIAEVLFGLLLIIASPSSRS
jgi:hypothetical protein